MNKKKNNKSGFLNNAIQMQWKREMVPHCVLDISRRCNISCRACYNIPCSDFKSVKSLEKELDIVLAHQKLTSVLIVGGEPLIHPHIYEIIKMVHDKGLFVEMSTNGVLFDRDVANKLAQSGLNMCSFHIESLQKRPDLPYESTAEERNTLREEKARICEEAGMDPGMMLTAFRDNPEEIQECVDLFTNSKYFKYFVITAYIDSKRLGKLRGDIDTEILASINSVRCSQNSYKMEELANIIGEKFDRQAFNYIGSAVDENDARWLSYRCILAIGLSAINKITLRPSLFDRLFFKCYERIFKKSVWYLPQCSWGLKIYMLLSGLLGEYQNFVFLVKNFRKRFISKTLIATTEVEIKNGKVILCASCVDAQIKNGKLVPTCIIDNVEEV